MNKAATRTDNLKSVRELMEERPNIDNSATFEKLKAIQARLWTKITARFPDLILDDSTREFQPYMSLDGTAKGHLAGYTSAEIDWAVCAWIGNPKLSFCNLHITLWMNAETDLPHLAFACGTFPVVFFFLDYIPRVEPTVYPEYLAKYLQPANDRFLQMSNESRLMPFVSQSVFVREAVSSIGLNFIAQPETEGVIELFDEIAEEHFDRWLEWSKNAEKIPKEKQTEMAFRDLAIRRNTAELDPANIVAERIYGKELTAKLVRGLWGGTRK